MSIIHPALSSVVLKLEWHVGAKNRVSTVYSSFARKLSVRVESENSVEREEGGAVAYLSTVRVSAFEQGEGLACRSAALVLSFLFHIHHRMIAQQLCFCCLCLVAADPLKKWTVGWN